MGDKVNDVIGHIMGCSPYQPNKQTIHDNTSTRGCVIIQTPNHTHTPTYTISPCHSNLQRAPLVVIDVDLARIDGGEALGIDHDSEGVRPMTPLLVTNQLRELTDAKRLCLT